MGNVLCGHIMASRKSVPWLYVHPISEIIAEAKAVMSCQDISLPQHHVQVNLPAMAKNDVGFHHPESTIGDVSTTTLTGFGNTYRHDEPRVFLPDWPSEQDMTDIIRTCLGTLFLERVGCPRLDYTAFTYHCHSTLKAFRAVVYWPLQNADCIEDVRDILQMIKTGLHRDELVDTLEQRTLSASWSPRFVQERVDRVASLLVMTEIGNIGQFSRRPRVSWRSGTLQQLINSHFTRERALTDSSIRLEQIFTAKSLAKIAGLRIFWTANLSDHLLLDREQRRVYVFHHATYLECQRQRYEQAPFAPEKFEAHELQLADTDLLLSSLESLLPYGLADETLTTLALLFPCSSRSAVPSWLRNCVASDAEHDKFLHAIRTSPLEPHERDIRHFYYWHDRIVVLKQAFDEAPGTHSPAQLWHDRSDTRQWYTLWSVLFFGLFSFCLGVVQVVLAGVQLQFSTQLLTVPDDRPSFPELSRYALQISTITEPPPKATTPAPVPTIPKAEERSDHSIGPGAIAGITIGGVALLLIFLGALIYRLGRRGGLDKAYNRQQSTLLDLDPLFHVTREAKPVAKSV